MGFSKRRESEQTSPFGTSCDPIMRPLGAASIQTGPPRITASYTPIAQE